MHIAITLVCFNTKCITMIKDSYNSEIYNFDIFQNSTTLSQIKFSKLFIPHHAHMVL